MSGHRRAAGSGQLAAIVAGAGPNAGSEAMLVAVRGGSCVDRSGTSIRAGHRPTGWASLSCHKGVIVAASTTTSSSSTTRGTLRPRSGPWPATRAAPARPTPRSAELLPLVRPAPPRTVRGHPDPDRAVRPGAGGTGRAPATIGAGCPPWPASTTTRPKRASSSTRRPCTSGVLAWTTSPTPSASTATSSERSSWPPGSRRLATTPCARSWL
jgi:hypothetical protein